MKKDREYIASFFEVMNERQNIWYRRFVKHLPREKWTNDRILKKTKYTNVYRQLDRGSLWCYYTVLKDKRDFRDVLFRLMTYRLCVRIETFEVVGLPYPDNFDPYYYMKRLYDNIVSKGIRTSTNAYLTLGGLSKGLKRSAGLAYCMVYLHNHLDELVDTLNGCRTGNQVISAITKFPGFAGFTAYEVYCDLCYKRLIPFTTNDAVNIGPGCKSGLGFMFPGISKITDCKEALNWLQDTHRSHFKKLGVKFKYSNFLEPVEDSLSLRTLEHWSCEMSKYWKQQLFTGKSRMTYDNSINEERHANVSSDGLHMDYDKVTYKKFKRLCNEELKRSKSYAKFLKKGDFSKEACCDYAHKLQKIIYI